jgi:hypothetical protein
MIGLESLFIIHNVEYCRELHTTHGDTRGTIRCRLITVLYNVRGVGGGITEDMLPSGPRAEASTGLPVKTTGEVV